MASSINPISASGAATGGSGGSSALGGAAPSKEMFLQLLVAQIKNQDPLNPADSVQFVSQLAQFSELEQLIAIRSDIEVQPNSGATGKTPPAPDTTNS